VRGYLLDTNIMAYWFDKKRPEYQKVNERIDSLDPNTPLRISAISLGEIEYGHRCVSNGDTDIQLTFKKYITTRFPGILNVRQSTTIYYGQIRARLFEKYAPKNGRKNLRPCQLVDPLTAKILGIQENDLWIVAQASEYNLVLDLKQANINCV